MVLVVENHTTTIAGRRWLDRACLQGGLCPKSFRLERKDNEPFVIRNEERAKICEECLIPTQTEPSTNEEVGNPFRTSQPYECNECYGREYELGGLKENSDLRRNREFLLT